MNLVSGIVVFKVIWWLVFLMVLPIGVKVDPSPEKGMATSAPVNPYILKKALITTLITFILWIITFLIIQNGWINLRP